MQTLAERFWPKVEKSDFCWNWRAARIASGQYGAIKVKMPGGWRHELAHRVSWHLVNGPIPEGVFVLHHCDNKLCVNPKHLFLGTQKDNIHDMLRKGRNVGFRKLTRDEVRQIRFLWATRVYTQPEIASVFKCCPQTISLIVTHKIWKG